MNKLSVYAITSLLALSLTACGSAGAAEPQADTRPRIECDVDDQPERDLDCGYWQNGQWVWYNWVKQGKKSYSPRGFQLMQSEQPPVAAEEPAPAEEAEEESGSIVKPKSKKKSKKRKKFSF